jgi:hypothetical protein
MAVEAKRLTAEDPFELLNLRRYNVTERRSQSRMIDRLRQSISSQVATDPFLMLP